MRGLSIFSPSSCSASSSLDLRLPIVIRRTAGAVSSACTLLHFTKKICSMYYTVCIHFTFPILDNTIIVYIAYCTALHILLYIPGAGIPYQKNILLFIDFYAGVRYSTVQYQYHRPGTLLFPPARRAKWVAGKVRRHARLLREALVSRQC